LCPRSVGLVARSLEENGLSTVVLTMMPEFNREIGIPRVAAVQNPFGRIVGEVDDVKGQRQVLQAALSVLENAETPGEVAHLPFRWHEEPKATKWHPPEMSPIINLYLNEIKKAGADARK